MGCWTDDSTGGNITLENEVKAHNKASQGAQEACEYCKALLHFAAQPVQDSECVAAGAEPFAISKCNGHHCVAWRGERAAITAQESLLWVCSAITGPFVTALSRQV